MEVITDLSPSHVCDGSLEPRAVASICQTAHSFILWHIPRFHAKVYVADGKRVIISSANLTAGGFYRNVEYGMKIQDDSIARAVEDHFQDFRATGTTIAIAQLLNYVEASDRVRESFVKQQRTVDPRLKKAFNAALGAAEDELIRLRLAGGAVHTVFAKTIHYLLRRYGPLPTIQLHELISGLHPDLCDDSVDRVIDGRHYGKKWKHAVRTAQQQLKRSGEISYVDGLWASSESA